MKPTLSNKQQESLWRKRICNFPDHFSLTVYKGEARAIGLVSNKRVGQTISCCSLNVGGPFHVASYSVTGH